MTKKTQIKTLLIASVFILILTAFRFIWLSHYSSPDQPQAVKGILDLRNWDNNSEKTVRLDGEWEFFPNALLTPNGSSDEKGKIITVPGKWNHQLDEPLNHGYGFGTYRLTILVPEDDGTTYGLRAPSIRTASRVFANGSLLAENGHPSDNPGTHHGEVAPLLSFWEENPNGEIELLIHVSNYDHFAAGGITRSIKFGTGYAVNKEYHLSAIYQLSVFIIMLVHSLYALILFSLRPKRKALLYFALGILCYAISVLLHDGKLILNLVTLNYEWSTKLYKASYMATSAFLLQFFKHMFFPGRKPKVLDYLSLLCAVSGMLTIVLPIKYMIFSNYNSMLMLVSFTAGAILIFQFIMVKNKDALLLLLALICVLSSLTWGIVKNVFPGYYPLFYPFDLILAIVLFSSFWLKRFFRESEEKEKLSIKLQEEDERKDQFLANTSHELRNPLHGIINIAESIAANNPKQSYDQMKKNLELLITISRRMSLTLNDLIDVTQLKEKGIPLKKQSLNVETVVTGVLDMFTFMIEGKNIRFSTNIPGPFPDILADEHRLIQILYNLIHNAVKFTNEGVITIRVSEKDSWASIQVIDTGIGMDKETQKRIFLPYEQADSRTADGGLGLGLSISKQLVDLHGGTLTVDSVPNHGSIFTFTLPLATVSESNSNIETGHIQAEQEIAAELAPTSTYVDATKIDMNLSSTDKPKILAIDDDPINLRVLCNILPSNKYDIVTVTSGQEALMNLNKKEWDLIIADVMMPTMSGYELTRQIREQHSISELPILLLTARNQIQDIVTSFLSGANDYISKPVNSLELKARVNSLTNLKQSINDRLQMEAAWLQAQIQPHFLFNTLNTIASLGDIDTERMTALLKKFGQYLQKCFDPINLQRTVPLEHELELLKSYVYIERERFGDRLSITWELDESIDFRIPPLTIQPLVENAVRHGILKRIDGGTILIKISNHGDFAEIVIQDDGVGMDEDKLKHILSGRSEKYSGVGIVNTDRRLTKIYGKGLKIESAPGQGTTITFVVPKEDDC
ncbi:integral membrane sensor hybrid histidine kinase [Bacillus freudenreichii]|nr:integral membrane sensor hybrid histidine kinase [Bacillus freudenreichii]